MELYFTELHAPGVGLLLKVERELLHKRTPHQELAILETREFGRVLLLDGRVMLTEKDEFIYHEMLIHPIFAFVEPGRLRRALVIGGGDGGAIRELLRYDEVEEITLVEIDEEVIQAALEYLPGVASGLRDPRVRVQIEDGFEFLERHKGAYDAIFVDSPDPIGPAKVLYSEEFYRRAKASLRGGGSLVLQTESPWYHRPQLRKILQNLRKIFKFVEVYLAPVPSYPAGWWSFTMARDLPFELHRRELPAGLRYFNEEIREALFALPQFLKDELGL